MNAPLVTYQAGESIAGGARGCGVEVADPHSNPLQKRLDQRSLPVFAFKEAPSKNGKAPVRRDDEFCADSAGLPPVIGKTNPTAAAVTLWLAVGSGPAVRPSLLFRRRRFRQEVADRSSIPQENARLCPVRSATGVPGKRPSEEATLRPTKTGWAHAVATWLLVRWQPSALAWSGVPNARRNRMIEGKVLSSDCL